jgi:hypothetical protein
VCVSPPLPILNPKPETARATGPGKEVKQMSYTRKAGRDADNGQFIPVKEARDRDSTAVVEHITYPGARKGTSSKKK